MYDNIKLKQRKQRINLEPDIKPQIKAENIQYKFQESSTKAVTQRYLKNGLVLKLRAENSEKHVKINKQVNDELSFKKSTEPGSIGQRIPVLKLHRLDLSQIKSQVKKSTQTTPTYVEAVKIFNSNQRNSVSNAHSESPQKRKLLNIKINLPECKICGEYYSATKFLQEHMKSHKTLLNHRKRNNSINDCHVCGKQFLHVQNLKRHLETHQPDEQRRKFQCLFCKNVYSFKDNLNRHIRKQHPTSNREISKPLKNRKNHKLTKKYSVCSKQFLYVRNLKRHVETHKTFEKPKKFSCNFCDGVFANSSNLSRHIRTQHSKSIVKKIKPVAKRKPFKCDHCSASFELKKTLNRHIKVKHSSLNKNKSACRNQTQRLKQHLKLNKPNTKRGKFQCQQCKMFFTQKTSLKRHVIIRHSTSKEHFMKPCSICDKRFVDSFHLKQHMETHKPNEQRVKFPCSFCELKFTQKYSVTRHILCCHPKIHSTKPV